MKKSLLEHINITVSDPDATAKMLGDIFDWHIRWSGPSMDNGRTVHVGDDDRYLALYSVGHPQKSEISNYAMLNGLNHIGVLVDDLDAIEKKVIAAGFTPHSHQEYEPGKRFYFHDRDGIEYEIVTYL